MKKSGDENSKKGRKKIPVDSTGQIVDKVQANHAWTFKF